MNKPSYRVVLTEEERSHLEGITKRGTHSSRKVLIARGLLLCDKGPQGPSWKTDAISSALGVTNRTVEHFKKRFIEEGLEAALERKARANPPREIKFDGSFEARLVTLACSQAPEGHQRWTLQLLAEKVVELEIADSVSPMTIHRALKKMNVNLTSKNIGKFLQKKTAHL